jgi:hypothetical protein
MVSGQCIDRMRALYGPEKNRERSRRRKIRLIEGNEKYCNLKKSPCKGTSRHVFICLRHRTQHPSPLTHCTGVYSILLHTGKEGGGVEPERRGEGQQYTKLGRKYQHESLYLQSITPEKHLPQSPFTGLLF